MKDSIVFEKVSPVQAIRRGRIALVINFIIFSSVFLISIFSTIILAILLGKDSYWIYYLIVIGFLIITLGGSIALHIYGGIFRRRKWITWAFSNVEDFGLLKKMAIVAGLIDEGSQWLEKLRLNNKEKESLTHLEQDYNTYFKFKDDREVP